MKLKKSLFTTALLLTSCMLFQPVAVAQGCDCSRDDDNSPWKCTPKGCMGGTDGANQLSRESQYIRPSRTLQSQTQPRIIDDQITDPYQVIDRYQLKDKSIPGDQFQNPKKPIRGN